VGTESGIGGTEGEIGPCEDFGGFRPDAIVVGSVGERAPVETGVEAAEAEGAADEVGVGIGAALGRQTKSPTIATTPRSPKSAPTPTSTSGQDFLGSARPEGIGPNGTWGTWPVGGPWFGAWEDGLDAKVGPECPEGP
jgi:hypothetical protein